jgi:hypothetical protein
LSVRAAASYFKAGEATLELVEAHTWGDIRPTGRAVVLPRSRPA